MNTSSVARTQERLSQLWGPRQRLSNGGIYLLPSDRCELERMSFEHYALKIAFGRNFFAPLVQPTSILDVGCGPGLWAFDMCRTFPHAFVVDFDIEMIPHLYRPLNYRFVQGSLFRPLPFADNSFDYVHQRLMGSTIPAQSWRSVLTELIRVTAPGGYIELVEVAPGLETMGVATAQLAHWATEAEQLCGINLSLLLQLPLMIDLTGAKTLFQRVHWLPVGESYGHSGKLMAQNVSAFFASLATFAQEHLALSTHEYREAWQLMKQEWRYRRTFCPFVVTLAQKSSCGLRSRFPAYLYTHALARR